MWSVPGREPDRVDEDDTVVVGVHRGGERGIAVGREQLRHGRWHHRGAVGVEPLSGDDAEAQLEIPRGQVGQLAPNRLHRSQLGAAVEVDGTPHRADAAVLPALDLGRVVPEPDGGLEDEGDAFAASRRVL